MENERQWLILRILHLSAQLSECRDKETKRQLQAALALYTQALRDTKAPPKGARYFS